MSENQQMLRSYSDESQRDGSPLLSVAGWIMTEQQASTLDELWQASLGELRYFHMKEAHHTKFPDVYARLLDCITTDHMLAGFHVAVNEEKYNLATNKKLHGQTLRYWFGGPYTFCMSAYMALVGDWILRNLPGTKGVDYFFDAGHSRSGEADMFFQMTASKDYLQPSKERYLLASHSFIDSKTSEGRLLQSSDILAWHFNYLLANGEMLGEGKKITRAVKCFYRYYPDVESIAPSILGTFDLEENLIEKRANRLSNGAGGN